MRRSRLRKLNGDGSSAKPELRGVYLAFLTAGERERHHSGMGMNILSESQLIEQSRDREYTLNTDTIRTAGQTPPSRP